MIPIEPLQFHVPAQLHPGPVAAAVIAANDDPFGVRAANPIAPAPVTFGGRQYAHLPAELAQRLATVPEVPAPRLRHCAIAPPAPPVSYYI